MLRNAFLSLAFLGVLAGQARADYPPKTESPPSFPSVSLVSTFAYDRGYALESIKVHDKTFEIAQLKQATELELVDANWKSKGKADREKLALDWSLQVLLHARNILKSEPDVFREKNHAFAPPGVTTAADGSVTVSAWVASPTGMLPGHTYYREVYTFSPQGKFSETSADSWNDHPRP